MAVDVPRVTRVERGARIERRVGFGSGGALTRKLGVTGDGLGHGGMRIKTQGNALILLGPWDGVAYTGGTVYAVVTFVESLGCRYLWPGETGKVVPSRKTVTTGPMDARYAPQIGRRHIRFMSRGPRHFDAGLQRLLLSKEQYGQARSEAGKTVAFDGGISPFAFNYFYGGGGWSSTGAGIDSGYFAHTPMAVWREMDRHVSRFPRYPRTTGPRVRWHGTA